MARSRTFFDDVRKELECSVCQEQFSEVNEPKILKCLHTFCKTCLEAWLRQQSEIGLSCPTCRQITKCPSNNVNSLSSNLFYKQMIEIVEAYSGQGQEELPHCGSCDELKSLKFYCCDCNSFLCEDCSDYHKRGKIFRGHRVKGIGNFESSDVQDYARKANVCKEHNDELRFYCNKCKICICRDCALMEHKDHYFTPLERALEAKKLDIEKRMQEVEANFSRLRNHKESLKKRRERVNNSIDEVAKEVNRVTDHCVNIIRQHEATMTQELDKQKASFQDAFSVHMSALDDKLMEIDSSLKFGKDILQRNNLPEILNVDEILDGRFEELSSPHDFRVELNYVEVKYIKSDTLTSSLKNALGKLSIGKTEPSFSIAEEVVFPDYWVPQPTNPSTGREVAVHLVQLDPTTDAREYKKVSDHFFQSGIQRIIRIERIQNPTLYKEYAIKKQMMDKVKARGSNERCLFHGAKGSDCNDINRFGLFCHKEMGAFGDGMYFAAQATYSAGDSPPDENGHRYMYLARVLVGEYAAGRRGLFMPPLNNNSGECYDTVVDDVNNPLIFVVFCLGQFYSEYLITFQGGD